jgi:outer membrane protein TolC
MKKKIFFWMITLLFPVTMIGQHEIDSVLAQIVKNNTTLSALQKNTEAEKIGNKTGIYLKNPEVGFNYVWSDPATPGNRTDINIRQSFDFPTAYGYRRQIADHRDAQADLDYLDQRRNILLEARLLCIDIVYTNALIREYEPRYTRAGELADAYQVMFGKGETGILELNKIKLTLLNVQKEMETLEIKRSAYLKQLSAMNGGKEIELDLAEYPEPTIPSDFDQWYAETGHSNPYLQWLDQQVQSSMQQEKLNRALSLPRASAGYMSENRTSEHLQGITVGISIPLWENKNTVKYMQVKTLAWQNLAVDSKLQFYNRFKIHFEKAVSLQKSVNDYKQSIGLYQNTELLKKAFEKGEISLLTYLMELTLTYSIINDYLQAENELNKAIAMLYQFKD